MKTDDEFSYYEYELDSYDCTSYNNPTYTTKNWPAFLLSKAIDNISALKILEVSIPTTYYTTEIYFSVTETITVPASSLVVDFVVTTSYYTSASSLLTEILSTLNTSGTTFTYTSSIDPDTNQITISNNMNAVGSYFVIDLTYPQYLGIPINSGATFYAFLGNRPEGNLTSSISAGAGCSALCPEIPVIFPQFYYVNSVALGSLINVLLPSNGLFSISSSTLGPQLTKVPLSTRTFGENTNWQDPNPDRWYTLNNYNLTGKLDFFISSSFDINTPLNFNGATFSIKLGILKKIDKLTQLLHPNKVISRQMQGDIGKEKKAWDSGSVVDKLVAPTAPDDELLVEKPGEAPLAPEDEDFDEAAPVALTQADVPVAAENEFGVTRPEITVTPFVEKTLAQLEDEYTPEIAAQVLTDYTTANPQPVLDTYLPKGITDYIFDTEWEAMRNGEYVPYEHEPLGLNETDYLTPEDVMALENDEYEPYDHAPGGIDPDLITEAKSKFDDDLNKWNTDLEQYAKDQKDDFVSGKYGDQQYFKDVSEQQLQGQIKNQSDWDTRNTQIKKDSDIAIQNYNDKKDAFDAKKQQWEQNKKIFESQKTSDKNAFGTARQKWMEQDAAFKKATADFEKLSDDYFDKMELYNQQKQKLESIAKEKQQKYEQQQQRQGDKVKLNPNVDQTNYYDDDEDLDLNDDEYIDKTFDQPKMSLGGKKIKRRRTRF